jgi:hypothetical protein
METDETITLEKFDSLLILADALAIANVSAYIDVQMHLL